MLWTYLSSLKTKGESSGLRHPKLPSKRKEENILFLASRKTLYFHFKAVKWAEKKWKKRQHHKYKITPSSENIADWRKCEWKAIGLAMQPRVLCSLLLPLICYIFLFYILIILKFLIATLHASPFAFLYPYYHYIFVHWQDFPNPCDFFMINDINKL